MSDIVLEAKQLSKTFSDGKLNVNVLSGVDLKIGVGETIAIIGRSGSGKSSLLHLLGGLDQPTSGEVILAGKNYKDLEEVDICALRNRKLGFVYQFHHLLPEFSAIENVAMPLLLRAISPKIASQQAKTILTKIGLAERLEHKVAELSGGERQRVAIARALVTEPACLLADEPTGNLDQETAEQVFNEMLTLNREFKTSVVIVTHDENLAKKMDRVLILKNGVLTEAGR